MVLILLIPHFFVARASGGKISKIPTIGRQIRASPSASLNWPNIFNGRQLAAGPRTGSRNLLFVENSRAARTQRSSIARPQQFVSNYRTIARKRVSDPRNPCAVLGNRAR